MAKKISIWKILLNFLTWLARVFKNKEEAQQEALNEANTSLEETNAEINSNLKDEIESIENAETLTDIQNELNDLYEK